MGFVSAIHLITCLLLIGVVLLQHGKGADLGATFGGSGNTVFGASGADNLFTRMTTGLAVIFMTTSIVLASNMTPEGNVSGNIFKELPKAEAAKQADETVDAKEETAPAEASADPQTAEGNTESVESKSESGETAAEAEVVTAEATEVVPAEAEAAEVAPAEAAAPVEPKPETINVTESTPAPAVVEVVPAQPETEAEATPAPEKAE